MSRATLPGPLRRLARQPLRVGAILLLAATAAAAAGIQNAAALALRDTVDANWRGAYDILVTPTDALDPIDGMLPPNTLASTGTGLTFDDLTALRAIDGVEVAAPLGEIVTPSLKFSNATLAIPRGFVGADDAPRAFRLTISYTTDDGLGERLVEQRQVVMVVDESTAEHPIELEPCAATFFTFDNYEVDPEKYPALTGLGCFTEPGDGITLYLGGDETMANYDGANTEPGSPLYTQLPASPQTATRITLVDPVAEQALLGEAGAFLDPLIAAPAGATTNIDDVSGWAEAAGGDFASRFEDQLAKAEDLGFEYTDQQLVELRALWAEHDDDWDQHQRDLRADVRYAPLLVTTDTPARLTLEINVEAFGAATAGVNEWGWRTYDYPEAAVAGPPGEPVGTAVADVSDMLNPFIAGSPGIAWPGADLSTPEQLEQFDALSLMSVGKPVAPQLSAEGSVAVLEASGYRLPIVENAPPDAWLGTSASPEEIGAEVAYGDAPSIWSLGVNTPSIQVVPVGSFSADDLGIDEEAASYVPLGAYSSVSSTLTAGDQAGAEMLPNLTGYGLVSPRTVAIGSLASAPLWGDDAPISSVRVRVGGIAGYDEAGRRRVIEVARAIEELGFEASIVAGSSPTDVDVAVGGYAFGTLDPDGTQTVGELGTVAQRWSELGAAARVSLAVSTATLAVLGIALAAGILLLGAVQVAGIPGRREQAAIMRENGFTRLRIARWFASEEVPGLLIVVLAAGAAIWLSGGSGTAAVAALLAVAAVAVTSIAAVLASARVGWARRPRDGRSRRLGARTVVGFGVRQAAVHPLGSTVHALAIMIVGAAAAGLVAAILGGRVSAGASSLADLVSSTVLWPQLLLGSVGILGGILLARLTRSLDLARRSDQWILLRAAGWTERHLSLAQRVEGIAVSVPALAVTAAIAWLGSAQLDLDPARSTAIALAAGTLAALLSFSTRRKAIA